MNERRWWPYAVQITLFACGLFLAILVCASHGVEETSDGWFGVLLLGMAGFMVLCGLIVAVREINNKDSGLWGFFAFFIWW